MTSSPFQPAADFIVPEGMVRSPFKDMPHALLGQDETSYVWINQFPVTPGHVLVLPKREIASAFELTADEIVSHMKLARQAVAALQSHYQPVGYTMGWNIGVAGGQSVAHAHMHIMPHYGDVKDWHKGIGRLPLRDTNLRYPFAYDSIGPNHPYDRPQGMVNLFNDMRDMVTALSTEEDAPAGYNLAWTMGMEDITTPAMITLIERHKGDIPNPRGGITTIFPNLPDYYAQKNAGAEIPVQKPVTLAFAAI